MTCDVGWARSPILASLLAATIVSAAAAQGPGSPRAQIVAEITRLDSIWLNAYVTADVDAVRPILADDFAGQIYRTVMDRDDMLGRVAASTGVEATIVERLVVNVYDEVAVAHAVRRNILRDGSGVSTFAYTDVYVYREGRWQCITGQSAPIVEGG
jgi:hypothetical protein